MVRKRLPPVSAKTHLIGVLLLLIVLDGVALYSASMTDRDRTRELARRILRETALSLEERVKRTVTATDLILRHVGEKVRDRGLLESGVTREDWERFRLHADTLPDAGSLWLLDTNGDLVLDSTEFPSQRINFSEREYFIPHRDHGVESYVGPVVKGKITGKYSFTVSRRVTGLDGRFLGIVLAAVDTDDFAGFPAQADIGREGSVAVFRDDGTLLLRQPMAEGHIGWRFEDAALLESVREVPLEGVFTADERVAGVKQMAALRKVQGLPLVVMAGVPMREVLREWRGRFKNNLLIASVALLALAGFTVLITRSMRREEKARRDLESALARNETLLEATPGALLVVSKDGRIQRVNARAERLFGYSREELTGKPLSELVPERYRGRHAELGREFFAAAREGPMQIGKDLCALTSGKREIPVDVGLSLVGEGDEAVVLAVVTDISGRREDEAALRASEARFRRAMTDSPIPVMLHAEDGDVIAVNHEWTRLTGYTVEMIPSVTEWLRRARGFDPATIDEVMARFRGLRTRRSEGEGAVRTADGRDLVWDIFSAPLPPLPDGRGLTITLAIDVTDRKQMEESLRESEERYRSIFENSIDGIFLADPESGKVLAANQSACRMLRATEEELFKLTREQFLDPDDPRGIEFVEERRRTGRWLGELTCIRMDGTRFHVEVASGIFTRADGSYRSVIVFRDMTEKKAIEGRLRSYMEKLEKSNRDLQDFAFVASHDLKEPLRKVSSFGERIRSRYGDVLEEDAKDYLDRMLGAAGRMHALIEALLAYSRISTAGEPFHRVALNEVVREALLDLEIAVERSGGRVEVGELPVVETDSRQMRQLFQNLLGNALKFSRKGVPPVVVVWNAGEKDGMVEIEVEDNGIGFDIRHGERIFAPFQRLHGRFEYEGTGMGLSICRRIVERHGGTIRVRSVPGSGSTFTVVLPVKHSSEGSSA